MTTNLLIALKNIIQNPSNDLVAQYASLNRMNGMGDALEFYVKDIFCGSLGEAELARKDRIYSQFFSYLGNSKNPPDMIIRDGDAIEVKKQIGSSKDLSLNSSHPKDFLHSNSTMITTACRDCEVWTKKDILYVIGNTVNDTIGSMWFVYGDCYAAPRETYESISNSIKEGIDGLPDVELGETNELGRVNKIDPLGITALRIRGMWTIKHPQRVFNYIPDINPTANFVVNAIMLRTKYEAFSVSERKELEGLVPSGLVIRDIQIKSPANPANFLDAKLIQFSR